MRFWDSSAIVPLLVEQPSTAGLTIDFERDPDIVVWWATVAECASALSRLEREEILDTTALAVGGTVSTVSPQHGARSSLSIASATWRAASFGPIRCGRGRIPTRRRHLGGGG